MVRRIGLAGSGRALDEEVARVEVLNEFALGGEVRGLDGGAGSATDDARRRSRKDVAQRRIATVVGKHRFGDACERLSLSVGAVRTSGDQRLRQGHLIEARAAAQLQGSGLFIERDDLACRLLCRGVAHLVANAELVLLRRERQRVDRRLLALHRSADRHQSGNGLRVLEQLLLRHLLAAHEEPPPYRPVLAAVVLEKLAGQPLRRPGLLVVDEPTTQFSTRPRVLGVVAPGLTGLAPRRILAMLPDQPVTKRKRGQAIVLVVGGDRREQRPVAFAHVLLVGEHRADAAAHLRPPHVRHKRLDVLQRVARDTGAEALPHDRVQVDEHAAAQEIVHLVLACRIRPHQLLDRGVLVVAIVVDVHARIPGQALVHEIDERLEHRALATSVVRPDRPVRPRARVVQQEPEQEVQAPGRFPERIAFDVEDDVAGGRPRQQRETFARLVGQRVPVELARRATQMLQRRLVAHRFERLRRHAGNRRRRRCRGKRRERRDARVLQRHDVRAARAGDEHQAVLGPPPVAAHAMEFAELAVLARIGLDLRL